MWTKFFSVVQHLTKINLRSVAFRIAAILIFMSLTTIVVSTVGISKIRNMNDVANDIFFSNTSILFPLSEAQEIIYRAEETAYQAVAMNKSGAISSFSRSLNDVSGQLGNFQTLLPPKTAAELENYWQEYKVAANNLYDELRNNRPNAAYYFNEFKDVSQKLYQRLFELNKSLRINGLTTYNKGKKIYNSVIQLQTWITILGVAIAVFIGVLVAISIIFPLQQLRHTSELLAHGDLRARVNIKSNDEVGAVAVSFNRALDELRKMVTEAAENAKNISTSSNELFKVTDETSRSLGELNQLVAELANGANNQTQTVESASQKLKKAIDLTRSVAEATAAINNTCKEASISAERGGAAAGEMTVVINKLVETVDITNQIAQNLSEDYQEIRQMVDVIRDIAEKTNLLSLNASIEAARAGEHGRGFAVVASNIRQLSIQARESVEHIDDRMNQIFEKTDKATTAMEQSTAEVDKGRNTLIETVNTFKDLVNQVAEIVASISQITDIAEQLSESNREVITEMANVSQISQDNLAAVEEVSATFQEQYASTMVVTEAARQLQALAIQLSASAEKFKV
ncbi:MAG: methyl-accepting chemotaxis protein [Bacillota bacterium]